MSSQPLSCGQTFCRWPITCVTGFNSDIRGCVYLHHHDEATSANCRALITSWRILTGQYRRSPFGRNRLVRAPHTYASLRIDAFIGGFAAISHEIRVASRCFNFNRWPPVRANAEQFVSISGGRVTSKLRAYAPGERNKHAERGRRAEVSQHIFAEVTAGVVARSERCMAVYFFSPHYSRVHGTDQPPSRSAAHSADRLFCRRVVMRSR